MNMISVGVAVELIIMQIFIFAFSLWNFVGIIMILRRLKSSSAR